MVQGALALKQRTLCQSLRIFFHHHPTVCKATNHTSYEETAWNMPDSAFCDVLFGHQHSSQELASVASVGRPSATARACGLDMGVSPMEEEYNEVGGEMVASSVCRGSSKHAL